MGKHILMLGAGRMGSIVAQELHTSGHHVTILDARDGFDATSQSQVTHALRDNQPHLVIGALPSGIGVQAATNVVEMGYNYLDMSFVPNVEGLLLGLGSERAAKEKNGAQGLGYYIPDVGLAPGLSNLLVGRALAVKPRKRVVIEVGGIALDESQPFGYVCTWNPQDLLAEYIRPAQVITDGRILELPPLSGKIMWSMQGVGVLESALTDGVRTLLHDMRVENIEERTLRFRGHFDAVKKLIKTGDFVYGIREACETDALDQVIMRIVIDNEPSLYLHVKGTPELSAMARCTAMTTASFAENILEMGVPDPCTDYERTWEMTSYSNVVPPERFAEQKDRFLDIMMRLHSRGVTPYQNGG